MALARACCRGVLTLRLPMVSFFLFFLSYFLSFLSFLCIVLIRPALPFSTCYCTLHLHYLFFHFSLSALFLLFSSLPMSLCTLYILRSTLLLILFPAFFYWPLPPPFFLGGGGGGFPILSL